MSKLYSPTIAGERLERCLREARVSLHPGDLNNSKLPEFPSPTVTLPIAKLKEFNANYTKLGEFAAYACGVPLEEFCDLHMLAFIDKTERERHGLSPLEPED